MDKKILTYTYFAISGLSLLALLLSITILIQKTSYSPTINNICSALNSQNQCEAVQASEYSKILGIDNPWFGIFGFSTLIIFARFQLLYNKKIFRRLITAGGIISGAIASYFLYLQTFIIGKYCIFCVIVDVLSIILMILSFYIIYKEYY